MPVQPQCQMQQNLQYSLVVDERYQLLDSEETKTLSMLSNNSDIDIFEPQKIPILPVQKLNSTEFRPVTHIEIIRPNPSNAKQCTSRRVTGANRVVPMITSERPFACKECDAKFKRVHALKKHMRNVHNEPGAISYPCSFCTMVFNNRGNMLRHVLRIHQGLRRFICGLCGSRYGQNQDLRHHLKMKHELDMPVISCSDKKSVNEIYVLPPIDQLPESHPHAEKINKLVAIEKEKIARFNQVQSSNGTEDESTKPLLPISTAPVSTSIPPVSTVFPPTPSPPPAPLLPPPPPSTLPPPLPLLPSSPPILLPNLTSPSPDISEIQISQKLVTLYRCGVCLIDFLERDLLELHIVETHKIKPALKCDTAVVKPAIPDAPIAKSQLPGTDHSTLNTLSPLTTVLNETTINAASKQISGKYLKDLADHKRQHLGVKPFACSECGAKFLRQRELVRHKMTHSGVKKYQCPTCDKTFTRLDQLKMVHMRCHETSSEPAPFVCVKNHKCVICNKAFALEIYLKSHLKTHQKQHSYVQCPKCPRRFATQQTLLVHDEKFHTRLQKHKEDKKKKIIDMPLLESEIDMTDMDVGLLEDDVLGLKRFLLIM
ncbi:hypothetical protein C0J52_02189 [Blattella germanica]|nr:hypothetical protein C0J52_02189 [Blattella germanica]